MSSNEQPGVLRLTPQQRLASSRREIVQFMASQGRGADLAGHDERRAEDFDDLSSGSGDASAPNARPAKGLWRALRRTLGAWWHTHPARLAADIVQPVIGSYAQTHPLKLLGLAAALGAAVVVAKPWRLLSLTGIAMAALRSTQVSHFVTSILSQHTRRSPDERQ